MGLTNCKNCGAPLHGWKCDYCGTEYEELKILPVYKVEHTDCNFETLSMRVNIDRQAFTEYPPSTIEKMIKRRMCEELAEKIYPYLETESWEDIYYRNVCFGGRIRVQTNKQLWHTEIVKGFAGDNYINI